MNELKSHYKNIFELFLKDNGTTQSHFEAASQFGREAISNNLGILSILSIHRECLEQYLKIISNEQQVETSNKASSFLEEVLSAYQKMEHSISE